MSEVIVSAETLISGYDLNRRLGYLSTEEVLKSIKEVRKLHPELELVFIEVNCYEPTKEELAQSVADNTPLPRRSEVVTQSLALNQTLIDIITLSDDSSLIAEYPTEVLQDVQAGLSPDEYIFVEKACKEYRPLLDAIAARGLDPAGIVADAWCCGHTGPDCDPTERICWPSLFYSTAGDDDIPYGRPIEGIDMRISLTKKQIIRFEDTGLGVFPIPGSTEAFGSRYVPAEQQRRDLKPLVITQPEGPSFSVSDVNCVEWMSWKFQVGFNSKEGASLHALTFHGRPVLHKFSFVEMVVPYGDPRAPHCLKNAFDAGEDGFGRNSNSLVLGCDCLGVIHYFDANLVRDDGTLFVIEQAVCMHEEDTGLGWKHTDWRTGESVTRRGRRLSISFTCTIANYDYGFFYHLYLDGAIEAEVKLTGALSTGALSFEEQAAGGRKYGISLGGSLYAPVHQHFFVARMDFVIDGPKNRVIELNAKRDEEGPDNPKLNAFYYEETVLQDEQGAIRDCSHETARFWKVVSSEARNAIGGPTGFKIQPSPKIAPFAPLARAAHLKRAQFLDHQLWVTPFHPKERYPGGEFPNQIPHIDGLPLWVQKNRNVADTDLVVWHVFGVTHLPRPEEWPIMPVEHCGFHIKPAGFFSSSPVMDMPAGNGFHSCAGHAASVCHSKQGKGLGHGHGHGTSTAAAAAGGGVGSDHSSAKHGHGHEHGHEHGHKHEDGHSCDGSAHGHSEKHGHKQGEKHDDGHGHEHGHKHEDGHSCDGSAHGHSEKHGHKQGEKHDDGHGHEHGHKHEDGHSCEEHHEREHKHGHKHDEEHEHKHAHKRDDGHGHDHGHGQGHKHGH